MCSTKTHEGFDSDELHQIYKLCNDETLQKEQDQVDRRFQFQMLLNGFFSIFLVFREPTVGYTFCVSVCCAYVM